MGISYLIYTFPIANFDRLAKSKSNNSLKIASLLLRNSTKDKEVLDFLSRNLHELLKKKFLDNAELEGLVEKFTSPLIEYYRKISDYDSWLKSSDRKILLKNMHKCDKLFIKAPVGIFNKVREMISKARKKDKKKLYFADLNLRDLWGNPKNYELSYEKGRVVGMKIFTSKENQDSYYNLEELERKEKEWEELRKWYLNKQQWLKEYGLNGKNFQLAHKIGNAISQENVSGTIFSNYRFEHWEIDDLKFLEDLKMFEDPITYKIEELEQARYKYPFGSNEELELLRKKENLVRSSFSFNPFRSGGHTTVIVFDLTTMKKHKEKLFKIFSEKYSKNALRILKNMLVYDENALIYNSG